MYVCVQQLEGFFYDELNYLINLLHGVVGHKNLWFMSMFMAFDSKTMYEVSGEEFSTSYSKLTSSVGKDKSSFSFSDVTKIKPVTVRISPADHEKGIINADTSLSSLESAGSPKEIKTTTTASVSEIATSNDNVIRPKTLDTTQTRSQRLRRVTRGASEYANQFVLLQDYVDFHGGVPRYPFPLFPHNVCDDSGAKRQEIEIKEEEKREDARKQQLQQQQQQQHKSKSVGARPGVESETPTMGTGTRMGMGVAERVPVQTSAVTIAAEAERRAQDKDKKLQKEREDTIRMAQYLVRFKFGALRVKRNRSVKLLIDFINQFNVSECEQLGLKFVVWGSDKMNSCYHYTCCIVCINA